jgi:putative hemolysin
LDETRAWDVMTPRVEVVAWAADRTLASIAKELAEMRYSRVPVYDGSVDEILGILYTRDAYRALIDGRRDITLRDLAREPFFVPGSIPLTRLLSNFQTRRIHMGVVIDEYGGTDGLVTLEDILEELVGEIVDETDVEHPQLVLVSENELLVEGAADLREINSVFATSLPLSEHRSLNGYLLDALGYVPPAGEEVEREGVTIRILQSSETQVLQALLRHSTSVPSSNRGESGEEVADRRGQAAGTARSDSGELG